MGDPKRRGRPYLDGETKSIAITLSLPPRDFSRLSQEAQQKRCGMQELIRRKLHADDDEDDGE